MRRKKENSEKGAIDFAGFIARTGIKQKDLARMIGVSPSMVAQMKKGTAEPSYSVCCALLAAGMTIDELFGKRAWQVVLKQAALENSGVTFSDEECRRIVEYGLASVMLSARKRAD